ncbi:MAG: extracellular solute-binding protein [Alphaproteobacteria bacterium]|nr:extracellular solute-binding protein [Alphaproteobacteria bacterium]
MKNKLMSVVALTVLAVATPAMAKGDLHIYNWADYTNMDLIAKFSKEYDVKVTVDSYDSNETMLSKVRAGNAGYDIVVPSDYTVKVMIDEGLLEKTEPNKMENYKNIRPEAADVYWDKGRNYTVPWQFGTTAFAVDTSKYKGEVNTLALMFNPPAELKGRINMMDDINSVMHAGERYLGIPRCGADRANLKKLNDMLAAAKPSWRSFSSDIQGKVISGDVDLSQVWNGDSYRIRQKRPTMKYAFPKEGIEGWMDNVAVLKGAANMENAKLFQNFMLLPENAALESSFAGYDNGIQGTLALMPKELGSSPEMNPPADAPKAEFVPPCPPEVVEIYNKIWTNLKK